MQFYWIEFGVCVCVCVCTHHGRYTVVRGWIGVMSSGGGRGGMRPCWGFGNFDEMKIMLVRV